MDNPIQEIAAKVVREHCLEYIDQSEGLPLLKNLPSTYNIFDWVKVRQRNVKSTVTESFNKAFECFRPNFYQTSVFANPELTLPPAIEDREAFYVFPIDGFNYLYCEQVGNTDSQYQEAFGKLLELLNNDHEMVNSVITELLHSTYRSCDLPKGIETGCEVLFFNVPYFYAFKKSFLPSYSEFMRQVLS